MAVCELTQKKPRPVHLVSHSNIKTKSKSKPNIQKKQLYSQALARSFTFHIATSTLRSIEHRGSFDSFILKQHPDVLSKKALVVQRKIRRKLSGNPVTKEDKNKIKAENA